MANLTEKLLTLMNSNEPVAITKEEVEYLFKVAELTVQIDVLEYPPKDIKLAIKESKEELFEILQSEHLKGFENIMDNLFLH